MGPQTPRDAKPEVRKGGRFVEVPEPVDQSAAVSGVLTADKVRNLVFKGIPHGPRRSTDRRNE